MASRSPYGERGLKSEAQVFQRQVGGSLSLRRAWIEIDDNVSLPPMQPVALLTESVD